MSETLEAGRELDALVAEKVMGLAQVERDYPAGYVPDGCSLEVPDTREEADDHWHDERHPIYRLAHENGWQEPRVVPFYSTKMHDAWLVVEKLCADGWYPEVSFMLGGSWRCELRRALPAGEDIWEDADTAALAICRAALWAAPWREGAA